ncbi:MAG: hypothetical protein CL763_06145 [Chloroflexi bacterium]|nr:hypothetical protein [Chloroflexota bacterium]|tara:strand:+ start:6666 stop:7880 length:1215 start_codon:yes stop_codon:yes gene_type:complete
MSDEDTRTPGENDSAERNRQFLEGIDTETVNPSSGNHTIMSNMPSVPGCVTNGQVDVAKHMEYRDSLDRKKNVVFYGPPGTGKTWTAREVAECWVDKKLNNIFNVTFHPSYSYEDFIEGFRPRDNTSYSNTEYVVDPAWFQNLMVTSGTATAPAPIPFADLSTAISPKKETLPPYELVDGIFKRAVARAKEVGDDEKVVVLIDEINRGNVAKIFGELITLIENNKRKEKYAVKLTYSREEFWVPENLYIIGTMNTADTSLIQVDSALRRRFAWKELMPDLSLVTNVDMNAIMKKINEKILEKKLRDKQIGHSYFMNVKLDEFKQVFLEDVVPLLQDYFYHDYDILEEILGKKVIDINTQTIQKDLLEKEGQDFIDEVEKSIKNNAENGTPESATTSATGDTNDN